jgi:hypothetical protein
MLANRTAAASAPLSTRAAATDRAVTLLSAVTNKPRSRFDVNSTEGRRGRDLFEAYMAHLGNPVDAAVIANVIKAVELKARAETLRLRPDVDLDQLIRLENAAERAERKLNIKPNAPAKTQSLAEYLAQRSAAAAPVAQPAQEAPEAPSAAETRQEPPHDDGEASEPEASDAE